MPEPVDPDAVAHTVVMPAVVVMVPMMVVVISRDRAGRYRRDQRGAGDDGEENPPHAAASFMAPGDPAPSGYWDRHKTPSATKHHAKMSLLR